MKQKALDKKNYKYFPHTSLNITSTNKRTQTRTHQTHKSASSNFAKTPNVNRFLNKKKYISFDHTPLLRNKKKKSKIKQTGKHFTKQKYIISPLH